MQAFHSAVERKADEQAKQLGGAKLPLAFHITASSPS
jgi:hypothetical protein